MECVVGPVCGLLHYQFDKLDHAPPDLDLVFLGDSSLGLSVDAVAFSRLYGKPAMNLALAGWMFNLPSMYNMLLHVTRKTKVRTMVLMLTPHDYELLESNRVDLAFQGVVRTARFDFDMLLWSLREYHIYFLISLFQELSLKNIIHGIKYRYSYIPYNYKDEIVNDYQPGGVNRYVLAGELVPLETIKKQFMVASRRHLAALQAIGATCRTFGIRCIYSHGTVFEQTARNSKKMIMEINTMVKSAGLILADPDPVFIRHHELGDSVNHIAPQFKSLFTEKIFARLRPHLIPDE
ncbi:MAG: hypothetical protein H7839_05975 [Magnetococcus sp. YQC-5]